MDCAGGGGELNLQGVKKLGGYDGGGGRLGSDAAMRVFPVHGKLHHRELLLPMKFQVQEAPRPRGPPARAGNGARAAHPHYPCVRHSDD